MKAILQYANATDGPYKNCGVVRTKANQDFVIKAVNQNNRSGEPEVIGYEVEVSARALELNTDFLTATAWYFRLIYPKELEEIRFGQRDYSLEHDGQIDRHEVTYHDVKLKFYLGRSEYGAYSTPVALPPSEGGVVVEDSGIYIE